MRRGHILTDTLAGDGSSGGLSAPFCKMGRTVRGVCGRTSENLHVLFTWEGHSVGWGYLGEQVSNQPYPRGGRQPAGSPERG